jgi:hypothetical protein
MAFLREMPDRRQRALDTSYKQQIAGSRLQAAEICSLRLGGVCMFVNPAASWYHGNQPTAHPCEHCGGILQHEKWCLTCDPIVQYAYGIVLDDKKLTFRDGLILHSLGVCWAGSMPEDCREEPHA